MTIQTIQDFAGNDLIDIRDIISRVEQLREELQQNQADQGGDIEFKEWFDVVVNDSGEIFHEECVELQKLEELLKDLCGDGGNEQWEGDWYTLTLIKDSYFEESMDEMVADCYDVPKNLPSFMTITLDYDALKHNYSEVEFGGFSYYYR